MKLMTIVNLAAIGVTASALALKPCGYSYPEYGGTPCNLLPPPPPNPQFIGTCNYFFCDENDNCSTEPTIYQKKTRTRYIYRTGADPYQYWAGPPGTDVNQGCCNCSD
jgi:hypothetical protein